MKKCNPEGAKALRNELRDRLREDGEKALLNRIFEDCVCSACGDPATKGHVKRLLCDECYGEIVFGTISTERAKIDCSSLGCPLEPNDDDSSPWQDNAIRQLEDG